MRKTEFVLSIVCFLGVAFLEVIEGVFIAVGLALLNFIWRAGGCMTPCPARWTASGATTM